MDFKTIIVLLLGISVAAYFTPTPLDLQSKFKNGQDLYASKAYQKAIDQYDLILQAESKLLAADSVRVSLLNNELNVGVRTAAYYQKANALRNLGRKDESIETYRIVEKRTDSPKLSALAQYQVYETFFSDKKYRQAIDEARTLIANHPMDEKVPQAWYDMGWAFRELSMIDSSNGAFQTLAREYPENELDAKARYQIAENYFDQSQWDLSIAAFQSFVDKYRPERFAQADWENVELKAVRDRKIFEAVSSRDVDASTLELVAKAQVKIGDNYRKKGQYDKAMESYRKVIATFTLMPTLVEATYIKMAEYTTEQKGTEEGILVYRKAIDENFSNKPLQAKLQYKIARTYQDLKQYDKAAREYLFFAQAFAPQGAEIKFTAEQSMFLAVSNFFNAKDHKNTITFVDSTLVLFPATDYLTKLYLYKGLALSELHRPAAARQYYAAVVERDSASNEAVIARTQAGKSYYDEKNYPAAVKTFEAALQSEKSRLDTSEAHYYLGLSYIGLPDYQRAISNLSQVAPGSSYYPFTFARVVRAYAAEQKYDVALRYLDGAVSSSAVDSAGIRPFVRLARAELYSGQQQFSNAVAEFDTVVSDKSLTDNTRMQAYYGRGLVYYEMGKFNECVKDLKTCLNSAVFMQVYTALVPQAKEKLSFALITLNRKAEGLQIVQEMIRNAVSEVDRCKYLAVLCEFHFRAADHAKAIEVGKQVLALTERDEVSVIRTYVTMTNAYGALQQPANAIQTIKEASEKFPDNPFIEDTFYHLAMIYFNGGDYANASEAFRTFMEKFPRSKSTEEAHSGYAYSLYQSGRADDAIVSYRAFLKAYPASSRAAEALIQIGEAYFNTRRFPEAAKEYRSVYTSYPNDENAPLAMFNEGWCYYQLQETDKMLEAFRTLADRYPKSKQAADAQFATGDYYYNDKQYDAAFAAYRKFVEQFPDEPRVEEAKNLMKDLAQVEAFKAYEKAMEFFDARNWKQAIVELTNVMEKFPNTEIAYGCKANIASCYEQLGNARRAIEMFDEIIRDGQTVEAARSAVFFAELHKRWIEKESAQALRPGSEKVQ